MEDELDIELRTPDVNEILTTPPKSVYYWSNSIIVLLIIVGITLAYFINYPEIINGSATLTTLNPPVSLVSKTSGKLIHLTVKNNQVVKPNEVLGVIENNANYKDVLLLDSNLSLLKHALTVNIASLSQGDIETLRCLNSFLEGGGLENYSLGEITPSYLLFLKSVKELKLFLETAPQQKEISLLNNELKYYEALLLKLEKQVSTSAEDYMIGETDYKRDKLLFEQNVISAREFEVKKREYLNSKRNLENQKININYNQITRNNIEKNKLQLQIQSVEQSNTYKNELNQTLKNLLTEIILWKQKYLFVSPVEGKVSFFKYWTLYQYINSEDQVFSIIPITKLSLIAKLIVPTENAGKLKLNQLVNIKLDSYPHTEYGMLSGTVKNISLLPKNKEYLVDVVLTNGLTTSFKKQLPYKEEMTGTAQIITENMSILERILIKFRQLTERN